MEKLKKIGIGLVTYNRPEFYQTVLNSIKTYGSDHFLVIVNDGNFKYCNSNDGDVVIHNNEQLGVAKSKNKIINYLLQNQCTDLFVFEDDVAIKSCDVFDQYIKTSEATNIPHFSFGPVEITKTYQNNLKLTCMYSKELGIDLYHHSQGGLMYFNISKMDKNDCMFDENYINAFEHVDVEYNLIQKQLQPPFWYFPDIHNSCQLLESIEGSSAISTITNKPKYNSNVQHSANYFIKKWGIFTTQIPDVGSNEVIKKLKLIKQNK